MTAVALSVRLACALATLTGAAFAQSEPLPGLRDDAPLSGTLKKARDTGTVSVGYRASSVPFSYLSARNEPIGYSIEICRLIVERIGQDIGRELAIKWVAVTPETRINAVASGEADLECGSTTNNIERQKTVSFSPTIFVSGTKLLVNKGVALSTFRDLVGKKVVVTGGTTNEKTMRDLSDKFKLNLTLIVSRDHADSFAQLTSGNADAFALDDVLLYGLLAQNKSQADYKVVGEFLSYDPYGIMYRKGDTALAATIAAVFTEMGEDHELERLYTRWFLRRLPSGASLDLPMSPQLETIFRAMATKPE